MLYARAIPSGPKLSSEHAARERECPACKPRLRPPTFLHNTRTLPPSLPKRPSSRYRWRPFSSCLLSRPRPVPNPLCPLFPVIETAAPDLPPRECNIHPLSLFPRYPHFLDNSRFLRTDRYTNSLSIRVRCYRILLQAKAFSYPRSVSLLLLSGKIPLPPKKTKTYIQSNGRKDNGRGDDSV